MPEKIVDPAIYDKEYFLRDNEGWREWEAGLDANLHPKFKRALELAGPLEGRNVLDIGCGRAELAYYCVRHGAKALGIDYSGAAIDVARQTIDRLPVDVRSRAAVAVGDINTYVLKERYDIVFMIEIAEHMYDWQLKDAFAKINSALTEGGRLIIMTPNYQYETILSPLKRIINIPLNFIKWPMRILRGKYKPASFKELIGKICKENTDRGELNKKMHVNVTTRNTLQKLLKDFDATIWCEDHSLNPLSVLTKRWLGREIVVIAKKKTGNA